MNPKHPMSYGMSGCKSVALLVGFCAAVSALAATTFERARVLTANTTVNVADGDVLEIGILSGNYTLTKTGGGTLLVHAVAEPASGGTSISLEQGMLSFTLADAPTAAMGSAFLHLDASKTNTMTLVSENGTNFVTRWNDASGGARYVSHDSASLAWRDASHKPFLRTGFQNGLPVVDLGSYAHPRIVDGAGKGLGWGGALAWSARSDDIREVFLVVSDVDDRVNQDGLSSALERSLQRAVPRWRDRVVSFSPRPSAQQRPCGAVHQLSCFRVHPRRNQLPGRREGGV